ncbi:YciI family protein [Nitrospira tepida]|nr:YciI family protein [Nitrospira tepida]
MRKVLSEERCRLCGCSFDKSVYRRIAIEGGTMSTSTPQADFLLLFRGTDWERRLSPEQFEQFVSDWSHWFERLKQEGRCTGGHPLHLEGKLVSGKHGRIVTDGPFTESKEAIGGYFYLRVANIDEAVEIAKQCPGLEYGCVVEVRPVAERCTDRRRASEQATSRDLLAHTAG